MNNLTNAMIRDVEISPGTVLAPMSGVTCSPFRRLIKELNPGAVGLVICEFVSAEGLTRGSRRSREMLAFHPSERPYGVQIFGYEPDRMREAAIIAEEIGADILDINCGCPAPKVLRGGGGCELMRQPEHLRRILKAVRGGIKIPLTIKMRSGWDEASKNALEIAKIAVGEGVEALTVHGRTRAQLYRGVADWEVVQQVVNSVDVPVFGSGDVVDFTSAQERRRVGVAGLFIGRAALRNPFVFTEVVREDPARTRSALRREDAFRVLLRFSELLLESFSDKVSVGRMKQLISQISAPLPERRELLRLNTFNEQIQMLIRLSTDHASGQGCCEFDLPGII